MRSADATSAYSPTGASHESSSRSVPLWRSDLALVIYIALGTIVVHLLVGSRYGFQRDELATMEDARHLAWGYVAYPPVTPFFARISVILFGTSITGFRVFAMLAEAVAVVLTGLMAREMGGRRGAMLVAAAAAVPFALGGGALMQYVSFDYLAWVLTAYFMVRLIKSEDPRWWIGIGAAIGYGMLSKYSMVFFATGVSLGVLLTPLRRYLKSKWLWLGVALALLIFLPNLIWQAQHGFISVKFLRHIHARDIRWGRTDGFIFPGQLKLTGLRLPLWVAGLYFCLFTLEGKRWRILGWMFLVPLFIFIFAKGRDYYMAAAYPMLYAAGAVWGERWLATMSRGKARAIRTVAWVALTVDAIVTAALFLPTAPINSHWFRIAAGVQGDYREEVGWQELVQTVAQIRDSLPPADREHLGIFGANYGEAGAINLYGPHYGLPRAISPTNSFWYKGYGDPPPQTVIVMGLDRDFLDEHFQSCRLAAHSWNRYGILNEETEDHPNLYVCRAPREGWPEFWNNHQWFG